MGTLAIIKRIEMRLSEIGMSKAEFYHKSGISSASFSQWRSDIYKPSTKKIKSAAEVLGVSVDYLLGETQSEWCIRFRDQLSNILENADREDALTCGADVQELWSIAEGNSDISFDKACEIADQLGVSFDFMIGREIEKAPANGGERSVSDDDIKFALFGGDGEITDAMYDEVRRFAAYIKQREAGNKKE